MKRFLTLALVLGLAPLATAQQKILSVPQRQQEHSQWCWAGSSQMMLNFKGKTPTQCAMVNYSLGINYACQSATFDWNSYANQPNYTSAITSIMNAWGVPAATASGSFNLATVQGQINASKPMTILWSWRGGGGHFVVLKGYNGSYLYFNDPWPGSGTYYRTHASTVSASDRTWNGTSYVR